MNRPSAYLAVNALGFVAFGLAFLVAPEALAARLDISLGSPSAVADFRAAYGGMTAGVGAMLALAVRRPSWHQPAVTAAALGCAGLLLGRVVTLATHGPGNLFIEAMMLMEAALALGGWWVLRERAGVPAGAALAA